MEGERLLQVTMELEEEKGRRRGKNVGGGGIRLESSRRAERKLEIPKEEMHNEYRAEMGQV